MRQGDRQKPSVAGKISMIGNLSGAATELNPGLIMGRRANIQGISVGSTQMFEALNRAISTSSAVTRAGFRGSL